MSTEHVINYTVSIRWWKAPDHSLPRKEVREALDETGFTHAVKMIGEGYHSGELNDQFGGPDDGEVYAGWWELSQDTKTED